MKPHKHVELIKQWADGAKIQWKNDLHDWRDIGDPAWINSYEYRIKPEPAEDVVDYLFVHDNSAYLQSNPKVDFAYTNKSNLKLTWDGESGKLKYAEVIK